MADVTTKELKVRVTVDAQTGQLKVFEADQDKVAKAVDNATKAMARQEQKIERQANGLIKLGASASGLNKALGGLPNILVEVGDKLDNVGRAGVKMGSGLGGAISKLGALGTAGLVAGAAFTGWQIGKWIDGITGWGKAIAAAADRVLGLGNSANFTSEQLKRMDQQMANSRAINWLSGFAKSLDAIDEKLKKEYELKIADPSQRVAQITKDVEAARIAMEKAAQAAFAATALIGQTNLEFIRKQREQAAAEAQNRATRLKENYEKLLSLQKSYEVQSYQAQQSAGKQAQSEAERQAKERIRIEQEAAEAIAAFQFKHHLDFLERQKELASKNTEILRQRIQDEIDAFERLKEINVELYLDEVAQKEFETAEQIKYTNDRIEEQQRAVEMLVSKFQMLAGILQRIGGPGGNVGGAFFSALAYAIENGASRIQAAMFSLGAAFDQVGQEIGGAVGKIISSISQLAMAFAEGGIVGAIVAGASMLVNALVSLFQKDWGAEADKTAQAIYRFTGSLALSTDFMERFTEAAKASGDAVTTFQLMINEVIQDLGGINLQNAQQIFTLAKDLISAFEGGKVSAQEFTAAFGQAFTQLAAFAKEHGGIYMDQLKAMIAATERLGVAVPEITAFLSAELDSLIGNVNKFAEQFSQLADRLADRDLPRIQQGWEKLGAFVGATIAEMIEQGRTWGEIMQQLGPSIETLIDTAERFGFKAKGAFGELLKVLKMMQEAADNFQRLDLMGDILDSLALFGRLGPKYIGDFFGQVKRTFADLLGFVGKDWAPKLEEFLNKPFEEWTKQQQTAFQSIIPYLLQAADYYREMGLPLPPMLKQLLDIAKAQGFISDTVPKPDPFEKIATELEKLNLNLENTLLMLQQMAGLVIPITFDVGIEGEGAGFLQKGPSSFKGLVGMHRITADSELMIGHRGEAIVDRPTADRLEHGAKTVIVNVYGGDPMKLRDEIKKLYRQGDL